jgi:peptidoglycan/xylan/chitin deacetylase (PgdA/CDA1 family)
LLPGRNYAVLPTKEKVVALTFDAAYDTAPLKSILASLEAAGADATFFLTGEFVRDFPSSTQLIMDAGYPIGNHSYSHPDFTELSNDDIRRQIERTAAALVKLGASDPKPLFRAPYGAYNKRVLSVLGDEGYVSVYWTIDTLDWKTERTTEQIKNVVLKNLKPGAIILMHVGSKQEAEVLPELLDEIAARGYRFVNLRDALPSAGDGARRLPARSRGALRRAARCPRRARRAGPEPTQPVPFRRSPRGSRSLPVAAKKRERR